MLIHARSAAIASPFISILLLYQMDSEKSTRAFVAEPRRCAGEYRYILYRPSLARQEQMPRRSHARGVKAKFDIVWALKEL